MWCLLWLLHWGLYTALFTSVLPGESRQYKKKGKRECEKGREKADWHLATFTPSDCVVNWSGVEHPTALGRLLCVQVPELDCWWTNCQVTRSTLHMFRERLESGKGRRGRVSWHSSPTPHDSPSRCMSSIKWLVERGHIGTRSIQPVTQHRAKQSNAAESLEASQFAIFHLFPLLLIFSFWPMQSGNYDGGSTHQGMVNYNV